ncbi:DUF7079 family protein [Pseudomonas sp. TUM22785]|uniref:DUF7079 family protein n=1 Tax=Pseudomonas sp. TUM22785 TaxID=3019098 RepID=UPI0023063BE1|nr:hypothetical protein [Pseudomonas sp. TUM22785]WCD82231.1 hypothetical protein PI990_09530 [Pseudomonas sp. TUM22785]
MMKSKNSPDGQLDKAPLWIALSDMFVDSETNYACIARVARNYPLPDVEFALFERVAPVCIGNMFSPVPPIWGGFHEKQLVADIEAYSRQRSRQGVLGMMGSFLFGRFIRLYCFHMWVDLRKAINAPGN